jgi:RHS repeat-associated core domain
MRKFNFYNIKLLFLIYLILIFRTAYGAPDIVAQNYAAANSSGIQSCTSGYEVLSGDITYKQPLISGKLPYIFNYKAPLRLNVAAAQDFAQSENSTLGWYDNYQSSIIVQDISAKTTQYTSSRLYYKSYDSQYFTMETSNPVTTTFNAKIIFVRLPGEAVTQIFKEENGKFSRLYSADPIQELNKTAIQNIIWDTGLGEYSLSRSDNNLNILKNGIKYTVSTNSHVIAPLSTYTDNINIYADANLQTQQTNRSWSTSTAQSTNTAPYLSSTVNSSMNLYRITSIQNKGRILKMEYDSRMNLSQVSDQYNNKLVFEHNFHETTAGSTQTIDESRLVTKVSYAYAGQSSTQVAEFKYQSYEVSTPSTGIKSKVYALIESNSTASGKNTYVNSLTELGAMKAYVASKGRIADASYYYPILKQVKNSLTQVVRQWDVTQNYLLASDGTYSTAQTTLRSFTPNGSETANDNTSIYNDITRSITTSLLVGNTTATNTIQTTLDSSSNSKITISSNGYPCLTSGNIPISAADFNTGRSQLNKTTDANNIVRQYSYDIKNRLAAVGEDVQRLTIFAYGGENETNTYKFDVPTDIYLVTPEFKKALHIKNIVDENGNITSQTQNSDLPDSTSKVTTYTYYTDINKPNYGLLESVDGPRTGTIDKVIYSYDTYGNLASQSQIVNGAARITQYLGYNTFGSPERIVNPSGLVSQFIYNTDGTLKSQTTGVGGTTGTITGQTTSYTYNTLKQKISETNPDAEVTQFAYNLAGRLIQTTLPNGNRIQQTYFPNGIVSSEKSLSSSGVVTAQNYQYLDANGRVSKTQQGSDATRQYTTFIYDKNGNVIQTTTASGVTEKWSYDVLNRVISHTDGLGNIDTKSYDVNDNIVLSKDALNAGSNPFSYRNGNVLTQEVNTDYGTKTYTYNEADQLTQRLHGPRKCNYNTLDELGRYKAFVCAANSGTTANEYQVNDNYTYDQSRYGRLDKVTTGVTGYDVDTLYIYDAYDRVTQKGTTNQLFNRYANTPGNTLNVNYGYSTGGKLTSMTLPSGRSVTYSYSTTGMLTGINLNGSALVRSLSYDGANRVTGWQWGASGNAGYTQSYNNDGSMASLTNKDNASAVNYSLTFGYDKDGRITLVTRHNGTKDAYTYDVVDRLLSESRTTGTAATYSISYTYDKNGNRLTLNATGQHMQPTASAAYSYTANTNKLASFTKGGVAQTFSHTANSELSCGTYLPTYDNAGRRKVDRASTDYYFMNYNHKNERSFRDKVINGAVSTMTQYIYDEQSHLIGEYDKTGALVEYVWMGDKPVAAIYGSGAATKIYYIVTDHLNTPRRLVESASDAVVWSWDSTAFGVGNPTGSITFNLRFPGQYYDVGTNQFYNHNRFYNPELGRYMEPDPIGLEGGLNPYAYAGSNPVMNVDPSGLSLRQMNDFGLSMTRGSDYSLDSMIINQQINQFNNLQTLNIGYGPNYTSVSYDNSYQNMWAATYSISVGANTTPILGIGGQTGTYFTTGDKGSIWEGGDIGVFGTGSKTVGLGAGIGIGIDYWKGGRNNFDGKAITNTLCFAVVCGAVHTDTSGKYAGWGFSIGGDSGGGAAPGASFTHSTDYTKSLTIRDLIQLLNKKGNK